VGIRATEVSLAGLGITASIQAVIVVVSGSVALLSDTLHNVTDALTAIPLWIAFAVGRRPATKRYTYGFNRADDWAGLVIVTPSRRQWSPPSTSNRATPRKTRHHRPPHPSNRQPKRGNPSERCP
jgi:hypothetical protein